MFQKLLLSLVSLCCLSSCVTFNTGAKLDSIGKAVPMQKNLDEPQFYLLDGVPYREVMIEYKQLNPKTMGFIMLLHVDTRNPESPAADDIEAPGAELYLVRLDANREDMPAFIKAVDFEYTRAKRVEIDEVPRAGIPSEYFIKPRDWLTLMPSLYQGATAFRELPTIRTTDNKIRLPLAVALSYGVDLPLTAASYAVGSVVYALFIYPFTDM